MSGKREAEEQLMNSSASDNSSGGDGAASGSGAKLQKKRSSSPNKRYTKQQQQHHPATTTTTTTTTTVVDMANTNGGGGAGDSRNNSASNLKKLHGDLEKMTTSQSLSSESSASSACSRATKCLLFIFSMTLTIILAAIAIAIFKFDLLANEDQCQSANQLFPNNQFKLFTTKTTYQSAVDSIGKTIGSDQAPSVFFKHQSLKDINDIQTAAPHNCKVVQLHYYGRHAARFPDKDDIARLNQAINNIQSRIDLSKLLSPAKATNNDDNKPASSSDSVTIVSRDNSSDKQESICSNPMTQYKQWRSPMRPDQDNLITDLGFQETEAIATRLRELFPQMFNASYSKIKIHTTKDIRTAQTAVPFIRQLVDYKYSDDCPSADYFPSTNLSSPAEVGNIRSNKCLKDLNEKTYSDKLDFHKRCDKIAEGKNRVVTPVGPKLNLAFFRTIAKSLTDRLKLPYDLAPDDARDIYKICEYETALSGSSIWCNLFTENELNFYEYHDDIEDYFKDVFGDKDQAGVACPVASNLMESITDAIDQLAKPQTLLHFTHSEVIRKMLAASFELSSDEAYIDYEAVERHFIHGSVPKKRDWRTSLFTPFSANLLFTVYECNPTPQPDVDREMLVNKKPYRVVVSLNEQPVVMERCKGGAVCELETFKKSKLAGIGLNSEACESLYKDICKKKYELVTAP